MLGAEDFDELPGTEVDHDHSLARPLGDEALEMDHALERGDVPGMKNTF